MTRRALLAVVAALLVLGGAALAWRSAGRSPRAVAAVADGGRGADVEGSRAPAGLRVRVEVLNASRERGLARRATMHLRDLGYDVVGSGNAGGEPRDTSLVLLRVGEAAWGERLGRAMGGAPVETRPDSSRHVDATVLVGAGWRPPPGPFRP